MKIANQVVQPTAYSVTPPASASLPAGVAPPQAVADHGRWAE